MLGTGGGRHGAAAVLACMWPLAALVVEFVTIPPVPNPPVVSAVNAPTPSAAALAILTAAAGDEDPPPRWSEESFARPSPMQGILQWLDTGIALPPLQPVPPSLATPDARTTFSPMGSFSRDVPTASAAGWRAWELLDATVDLIAPTGDTLLWDARYRHDLSADTGAMGGSGKGVYTAWAVDPVAENVLDWGRRGGGGLGSPAHTRRSSGGRGVGDSGGGFLGGGDWGGGDRDTRRTWFVDSQGKKKDPLADAGGVPWVLVRMLLAIFVSGGAAEGHAEAVTSGKSPSRRLSGGSSKGGGGAGTGPPSIALVALQRLIALLNSLESSGYQHFEFEVLHMAARVSAALRTTRLTPQSAWVLGALQLLVRRLMHANISYTYWHVALELTDAAACSCFDKYLAVYMLSRPLFCCCLAVLGLYFFAFAQAKCLATQGSQIEDLLVAAEERLEARNGSKETRGLASPAMASSDIADPAPPRTRLVFSRGSKPKFWLWDLLSGGGGGKANRRRRITPKGVLHQIAAETPSLAAVPTADLALEIIRRTLGIELPGSNQQREGSSKKRGGGGAKGSAAKAVAAPLTWDLLEAAFEPVSHDGAGHEAAGLAGRLDRGGMHNLTLQVLVRVRRLEERGREAGNQIPADMLKLGAAVKRTEADRALTLTEANER